MGMLKTNIEIMKKALNEQGIFFKTEKAIKDSGLSRRDAVEALKEMEKSGSIFL